MCVRMHVHGDLTGKLICLGLDFCVCFLFICFLLHLDDMWNAEYNWCVHHVITVIVT